MTDSELIKRILIRFSKGCTYRCLDLEKDCSIYLYEGTYYRISKEDVPIMDELITKLKKR